MESFNSFDEKYFGFQGQVRNGSSSNSSLVLDSERGVVVRASDKAGKKVSDGEKALIALRNHSEAERRRRGRINNHVATLRSLIPGTNTMKKAALLAEAINQLKELRRNVAEATNGVLVPTDIDEVRVEKEEHGIDGTSLLIRASLCCDLDMTFSLI